MVGGAGADSFVFAPAFGHDAITTFADAGTARRGGDSMVR